MYCPRIEHFRRLMPDGKISICGHMTNPHSFDSLNELESSNWFKTINSQMKENIFPTSCIRCKQEEELGQISIRQHSLERDKFLKQRNKNYLIIGGVLDNICNSACQFCDEKLSTKIGSLKYGKDYKTINNLERFKNLPQDRILELHINGGEPSNSPNYKNVLENLPPNLKVLRINTNASKLIDSIENILSKNIKVIITISLDGTESVFEYARYPLKWKIFNQIIDQYSEIRNKNSLLNLNFWLTVSAYTIGDFNNIKKFAESKNIELNWGFLQQPEELNIIYKNPFTLKAKEILKDNKENLLSILASDVDNTEKLLNYINYQDKIRGTNYKNCYEI